MSTLLVVNSSPRGNSVSRRLTRHVTEEWKAKNPSGHVIERDLSAQPLPYVDANWIEATITPAAQRTIEHEKVLAQSDVLIDELLAADIIVLGVPMHNFSIPASLKAWIDQVVRAGKTFRYGGTGPEGLLPANKKALVIVTRGGAYGEGSPVDFQVPYLRHMLGFIGLKDVTIIEADKQAYGVDAAQQSIDQAVEKLSAVTADSSTTLAVSA
jgi:FMN-dependent NADH-azoreductase